ncbi:MAG: HAD family hydrolase [Armatimonadetes bacterium]|nr:HAD family hydrolase [Armatimonadota bacterium]
MRPVIVFDFDGTLVDAYEIKRESYWRAVSEVLGLDPGHRATVDASYARTSGAHRFVQLADTAAALGRTVSDADREEFSRRYSGYNEQEKDRMRQFPSARAMLEALREDHDLVLSSGLPHANLVAEAARHGLAEFFVEIEGGDKGRTLDRLRAAGRTVVVFVGDTPHDEEVAASRGVPFYRVGGDAELARLPEVLS